MQIFWRMEEQDIRQKADRLVFNLLKVGEDTGTDIEKSM